MLIPATDQKDKDVAQAFMRDHGVVLPMSADFNAIGRVSNGKLLGVVVFNGFNGKMCSMHCAGDGNWISREFIREAFRYPFETLGLNYIVATVAGDNARALKMDKHFGFKVIHRLRDGWDDGVDTVFMVMSKHECRYLAREKQDELQAA